MDEILVNTNWIAVVAGTAVSFGLGMVWFGPLFGKTWAAGSHNITPPEQFPVLAVVLQFVGIFLMATVIGATATIDALVTAILIILGIATLTGSMSLFSQKSAAAALIDASYMAVIGVIMVAVQAVF